MIEGAVSSYEKIKAKTSLRDILDVACSFEASARDFYTDLIPKVGKNVRWVVEELAAEEQEHLDLLSGLAGREDIAEQIKAEVRTPATDSRFSDCVHLPDLGPSPDDQAVLQYAMGREQIAMEHYRSLAESTAPGPIHDLFSFLAGEETKHKTELEKVYYEVVHSGGV
ncbi:MAG: ferritin family protein [Thiocapsa sp.]|jgi:rubrerythrin|nr:ferritin family protein [Thiocapsa sp.]MCG6895684.1 ferritin family protein [Thiocapsa sp.]MCG6985103.1 ferritin family protein [Thiocapsa sp.]